MNEDLRKALRGSDVYGKLHAIEAAAQAGAPAASLLPDLAALLASDEFVRGPHPGHVLICQQAANAIMAIGVAPDVEVLRALLASDRVNEFPVACFDQGMYVGDYATEEIAPAGLAASLVHLLGLAGLSLLPELSANARNSNDKIAGPALRAIDELLAKVAAVDVGMATQLRREIEVAYKTDAVDRSLILSETAIRYIRQLGSLQS